MTSPVDILVHHVLLTSRGGLAACAAEGCPWEDRFWAGRDRYGLDRGVPLSIRVSHAEHQLALLNGTVTEQTETPRGGW
jgi:hypothetical protein